MSNWKNRQSPTLSHLMSLFDDVKVTAFINGHLILEALLVQFIDFKLQHSEAFDAFSLNFPMKADLCVALRVIDDKMAKFLKLINTKRNHIAHRLGHTLTFDDAYALVQEATRAGVDFSDDAIHADKAVAADHYGTEGIIQELFANTAQHLGFIMEELGGNFQFE